MKIPPGDLIVRASILQNLQNGSDGHSPTVSSSKSVVIPLHSGENESFTLDSFVGQLSEVYSHLIPSDSEDKTTFQLKWRDEDMDLVTIGSDAELYEALRTCQREGRDWVLQIFLIVGNQNSEENRSKDGKELAGVIKVFSKMQIENENSNDMMIDSEQKPKEKSLMLNGSEWNGYCYYAETKEVFRFKLKVWEKKSRKEEKKGDGKREEISGIIEWAEPLNAKTKFMGLLINEETFKFREYEIISGEDQVTVPTDYVGTVDSNTNLISGNIKTKKNEPPVSFELEFAGFNSKRDGFLSVSGCRPTNSKRKYNLVVNNSGSAPTVEDKQRAFKVLTQGTTYWYDRSKKGELELRPKNDTEIRGRTKSCPTCNNPMFEQYDINGRKILACSSYPNCKRRHTYECDCYNEGDCDFCNGYYGH